MELSEIILKRRSVRHYDSTKTVTEEQVNELMKAVLLAPTWKNSQTGRYYALVSPEKIAELSSAALPEFNQKNSAGAALIVATFKKDIAGFQNGEPNNELGNHWGAYDLGLQTAYLILKATDMGLDTLIMGIRDAKAIRETLCIPEDEEIVSVLAVGYRENDPTLSKRKDISEIVTIA